MLETYLLLCTHIILDTADGKIVPSRLNILAGDKLGKFYILCLSMFTLSILFKIYFSNLLTF